MVTLLPIMRWDTARLPVLPGNKCGPKRNHLSNLGPGSITDGAGDGNQNPGLAATTMSTQGTG